MKFITVLVTILCMNFAVLAQTNVSTLLEQLKTVKADSARIEVYNSLFGYYQHANPDSVRYYLESGLKEFTAKGYKNGIAAMLTLLAYEDGTQGRMGIAKQRHAKAMDLFKEVGNRRGMASTYNGLGVIEGRMGNENAAIKYFMAALKEFEGLNDVNGIINTYLKLGVVNEHTNNLDKALEYYNKAVSQVERKPVSSTPIEMLYNNIGIVYGKKGEMTKAISYFEQALKGSENAERTGLRIQSLTNLGIAYDRMGDSKRSLDYYHQALQITQDKDLPEDQARIAVNIAAILVKTDPEKGMVQLKNALEITKRIGNQALRAEIYGDMVETYGHMKKYKEALETVQLQKALEDSLFSIDKSKEIANLQSVYELERSNAKVNELEILSRKNNTKRNIIFTVATVLGITLLLLWFVYRRSSRLNTQLSKREADLQRSNTVKDKLFSIIGHDLRGPIGNIPVMLQMLEDKDTTPEEKQYITDSLMLHLNASKETLDKLLYWGQAQIKGIGMKQVDLSIAESLEHNLTLIKSPAEQKQITLTNKVPAGLMVHADPAHFDFVIRNLLSNSVKFTHAGGSVSISADTYSRPGFVIFAVKDTGVGIEPDKVADIFKPFSSSTRGTADEKGTSIGLMLCKEFVTENGGDIWVESRKDAGSTFYFSLKAA